jgi:hypothetical protein
MCKFTELGTNVLIEEKRMWMGEKNPVCWTKLDLYTLSPASYPCYPDLGSF